MLSGGAGFEPLRGANHRRERDAPEQRRRRSRCRWVGWAPDGSPTDASAIVPGRKEERAGDVAGRAWVRWREVEGGPGLVASVSSGGDRRPAHLQRHLGRWGRGGDDGGQSAQVNLVMRNVKGLHPSSRLVSPGFLSLGQRAGARTQGRAWWRGWGGDARGAGALWG